MHPIDEDECLEQETIYNPLSPEAKIFTPASAKSELSQSGLNGYHYHKTDFGEF